MARIIYIGVWTVSVISCIDGDLIMEIRAQGNALRFCGAPFGIGMWFVENIALNVAAAVKSHRGKWRIKDTRGWLMI